MANEDLTTIQADVALIKTAQQTQATKMTSGSAAEVAIQAAVEADRKPSGLPSDAVPIHGACTVITEAVAVEIIAAPSALKALFISQVIINNKTIAEDPVITVQDGAGSPVAIATVMPSTNGGNGGNAVFTYDPPVELTAAKALNGIAGSTHGDTIVHASGWVGTATT